MARQFSIDNAFLHFARADGPRGYIWKYMLAYLVGACIMAGAVYFLFKPFIDVYVDLLPDIVQAMDADDPELIERELSVLIAERIARFLTGYFLWLLLSVLFWAMFEASVMRRYVRETGFTIGLGADELRLVAVGLIWFVMFIIAYFLAILLVGALFFGVMSVFDSPAILGTLAVLGPFFIAFLIIFFAIRFSAASALTIRDRKIHFFDSWAVTRGRFWPLFFAFLILGIMITVIWTLGQMFIFGAAFAAITSSAEQLQRAADTGDPFAVMSVLTNPGLLYTGLGIYAVIVMLQGLLLYMWAGPAALAAKTDPRGGAITQAPEVFT